MKDNYMGVSSSSTKDYQRVSVQENLHSSGGTSQMLQNNKTYNASIGQRP